MIIIIIIITTTIYVGSAATWLEHLGCYEVPQEVLSLMDSCITLQTVIKPRRKR